METPDTPPSQLSWDLLDRYFAGECSSAEFRTVQAYLAQDARAEYLLRHAPRLPERGQTPPSVSDGWSVLVKQLALPTTQNTGAAQGDVQHRASGMAERRARLRLQGMGNGLGHRSLRRIVWSASSIVVIALVYVVMRYRNPVDTTVTRTYTTHAAQQATFTLRDSTRVTLAPRTTLQLVQFGPSSRRVVLKGQAYFEVARVTGAPFLVYSGSVTTQVLGTAFLVRHYAYESQVHVAVTEGKVALMLNTSRRNTPASRVTLAAGQIGDVTDSTVLTSTVGDLTGETDWLRGRLVFQQTSVAQVLLTLSRWYGYEFRCTDSALTKRNITVALDGQSSAAALALLEQLLDVRLTMVGDTVTLTPRQRRSAKAPAHRQEYDVWIPTREVGR